MPSTNILRGTFVEPAFTTSQVDASIEQDHKQGVRGCLFLDGVRDDDTTRHPQAVGPDSGTKMIHHGAAYG